MREKKRKLIEERKKTGKERERDQISKKWKLKDKEEILEQNRNKQM